MDSLVIRGGRNLQGEVAIPGAKDAALPALCTEVRVEHGCLVAGIAHGARRLHGASSDVLLPHGRADHLEAVIGRVHA